MEVLPDDIWLQILASVPPRDVARFGTACKPCRALALKSPVWDRLRVGMKLHPPKPRAWKLKTPYHVVVASACSRCLSHRRLHRQAVCSGCIRTTPLLQRQWDLLAKIRKEQRWYSAYAWEMNRQLRMLEGQALTTPMVETLHRLYTNLRVVQDRVQALKDQYTYNQKLWVHYVDHVLRYFL